MCCASPSAVYKDAKQFGKIYAWELRPKSAVETLKNQACTAKECIFCLCPVQGSIYPFLFCTPPCHRGFLYHCCCPHHRYSGCQLVSVFVCLNLQIFNKVRAQWHWHKYAMREAKQVKTGKKNGEKTIFLTLSFRSISCSIMQGTGFPCFNAHFSPYLYRRIV